MGCSGEAVSHRILPQQMVQQLFLVVALSMALTPFLADLGQRLGKRFDTTDMKVGLCGLCRSYSPAALQNVFVKCMVSEVAACHYQSTLDKEAADFIM